MWDILLILLKKQTIYDLGVGHVSETSRTYGQGSPQPRAGKKLSPKFYNHKTLNFANYLS